MARGVSLRCAAAATTAAAEDQALKPTLLLLGATLLLLLLLKLVMAVVRLLLLFPLPLTLLLWACRPQPLNTYTTQERLFNKGSHTGANMVSI